MGAHGQGDLAGAMAGYYSVLAAGISKQGGCTPRWVNCKTQCSPLPRMLLNRDVLADVASSTGTEILSGCLPVFKSGSGTETTCESPGQGPIKELLGVTCIDLNIIVEISTLRAMSCWDDFWADVVSETEACATVSLTQSELETLRGTVSSDSVCGSLHIDKAGDKASGVLRARAGLLSAVAVAVGFLLYI